MNPSRWLSAAVALFLVLPATLPASSPPADPDQLRQTFLELVNEQRGLQGLAPVALDPALSRAAQAHADDMTARQYLHFKSPEGREIEHWTREAGYNYQLVAEKLASTPDAPRVIAEGWSRTVKSNRNSVFHPNVKDLGIGIGEVRGMPVYTFVLARSEKSYLEGYIADLYQKQEIALRDVNALREELLWRVNELRAAKELHPLSRHFALDKAAQEHAEAVLAAVRAGQSAQKMTQLPRRVKATGYRAVGAVGERVVADALTPDQAMAALMDGGGSQLLGKGFTQIGLGVAFERLPEGFRVIWVQCLARPWATPTEADTRDPGVGESYITRSSDG